MKIEIMIFFKNIFVNQTLICYILIANKYLFRYFIKLFKKKKTNYLHPHGEKKAFSVASHEQRVILVRFVET